jgi:hypothetical protein
MTCELRNHKGEIVSVGMYTAMVVDAHSRADQTGKVHSITMGDTTLQLVPPHPSEVTSEGDADQPLPMSIVAMLVLFLAVSLWQMIQR